jgi:hypothetical protein
MNLGSQLPESGRETVVLIEQDHRVVGFAVQVANDIEQSLIGATDRSIFVGLAV